MSLIARRRSSTSRPTPTPNGQPRESVGGYVIERLASMKQQNIGRSTLLLLVCLRIAYLLSCSQVISGSLGRHLVNSGRQGLVDLLD